MDLDRRAILKAAALSAAASALGRAAARAADRPVMPESAGESGPGALRRGMIGFMLGHEQFRVPELVDFGVAAERAGFDLIAASDHFQPWQANEGHSGEAWVTLAALGQRTSRVWMGTTVTCPTLRYNPAVVAEAFASLAWLTPGRVFLGLGSGEALNEEAATGQWPKWPERSERLVEATDVIRRLWTGEPVQHRGKYYAVDAKLYDAPPHPVPILMAGNSGKALERCGRYADGLITDPGTWKRHRAKFEAGAKAAGKNPADMPVLVEQFVTVGSREDAAKAADLWRFLPKAFNTYFDIRDPKAIEDRAAAELPIDEVIADWIVSADPAEHAEKIASLFRAGATIVNVHSGQADQKSVIEFYGREVLPKVAPRAAAAPA
jgi:F420-dependent hydroxymycolic acid dehydrogenase